MEAAGRKALISWRKRNSYGSHSRLFCVPPLEPLKFWIAGFLFASHREHSMRMFIWLTLLCMQWRVLDMVQRVAPSSWRWLCPVPVPGWLLGTAAGRPPSSGEFAFCLFREPVVCSSLFILHSKPQTLDLKTTQGNGDLFIESFRLVASRKRWISVLG